MNVKNGFHTLFGDGYWIFCRDTSTRWASRESQGYPEYMLTGTEYVSSVMPFKETWLRFLYKDISSEKGRRL